MVRVYMITAARWQPTRLYLSQSRWGFAVQEALAKKGFVVAESGEDHYPDLRDAAEKSRARALIDLTGL
jgi:hypothetical protein